MDKNNSMWTGLSFDKKSGEELSFFVWKDNKKIEFTPDEARKLFPTAMGKHARAVLLYNVYST